MTDIPTALAQQSVTLTNWAFDTALPLWWTRGADPAGGFHDALLADGSASPRPRRARVQARQSYSYALAGKMGWQGPWQAACQHGLDYLNRHYLTPDGFYRRAVTEQGEPATSEWLVYDQTFYLLASAWVSHMVPQRTDLNASARALADRLLAQRDAAGGFRENDAQPFQSNPHMHMLEAALAWVDFGGGAFWEGIARDMVALCLERFLDPASGALMEYFDSAWNPLSENQGQVIEPGHQFEWAWLLERWHRHAGDARAHNAALRLFEIALRGIDPARHVAIDTLSTDLSPRGVGARLWPQTERLKACVIFRDAHPAAAAGASDACIGLGRYLDLPAPGLWPDKMRADGTFQDEPAPATSLYHILCAVDCLRQSCI